MIREACRVMSDKDDEDKETGRTRLILAY